MSTNREKLLFSFQNKYRWLGSNFYRGKVCVIELNASIGFNLSDEGVCLQEWLHVQTVFVMSLHHQMCEPLQLVTVQPLSLVVVPGVDLLSEPGEPSLTGQHVQVNGEVGLAGLQLVEFLDGLAPGVVETGDVEQTGGHDHVGGEVADKDCLRWNEVEIPTLS